MRRIPNAKPSHVPVVVGLCLFGGIMFSYPFIVRTLTPPIDAQNKPLTGTQRMRGVYFNFGSTDVGPDPDWDVKTGTWKGWDRRDSNGRIKKNDKKNEK